MHFPDKCSHGKTWEENCDNCNAIAENESLSFCAGMARRAAAYYERHPGHVCPETIIDLYRAVARIAELASQQQKGKP